MTCWEQLGISPTTDAKTIKKAYAEKVKTCHQEDNPELWAQLHDAYMQAVKYAQTDGRIPLHPYVVVSEQKRTKERSLEQEQTGKAKEAREQQRFAEYTAEQDDRRMEQLFDQLRENERQAKRADMEELRGQIEKLSQAVPEEESEYWKQFLESWLSQRLYLTKEYWEAVLALLEAKELQPGTYRVILQELKQIRTQNVLSLQGTPVLMNYIDRGIRICERKLKPYEDAKRSERQKSAVFGIVFGLFLLLFVGCRLAVSVDDYYGTNPKITSPKAVKTELAVYLNEKYETDEYQADAFELEKLETSVLEDGKYRDVVVGYRAILPGRTDFKATVLFEYDKQKNAEGVICFDNLQVDEIERSMEEEVKSRLGISKAEGYLSEGEGDFAAEKIDSADVAYHTFFTGDLKVFADAEEQTRKQIYQRYSMANLYTGADEMNGSFLLYYSDAQVADIRERLTMDAHENEETLASELEMLQEEMHMQMIAIGLPQSYYEAVFSDTGSDVGARDTALRAEYGSSDLTVPLNPAFVSVWFMEYRAVGISQIEPDWVETENRWMHMSGVTELADGIYVMVRTGDMKSNEKAEDVLQVEVDKEACRILVEANETCVGDYVIALDKQVLGMGDEYTVCLVNPEDAEDTITYRIEPYTNISYSSMGYTVLFGEDMLFLNYDGWSEDNLEICW